VHEHATRLLGGHTARRIVHIADHDVRSFIGQTQGGGESDAAGTSGNDGYPTF
jgi:hypothetical protein